MRNKFLFSAFVYFFIIIFIFLGSWQIYRLNWKLNLISQIENSLKNPPIELSKADKKNYLRIKTSGIIDFSKQIYLYNLNEEGKPGFDVINPIEINNENFLINRGWIPFEKKNLLEINSFNEKNFKGTLKIQNKPSYFKPPNDIEQNYWFTLNRDDIFSYTGKNFSNYLIYLDENYIFPKSKKITANISNNHKKYAITWFSMAISILLIYLYFRKENY